MLELFKAYDLNHLLILEMAQDQFVSKIVPYTQPKLNLKRYTSSKLRRKDDQVEHGGDAESSHRSLRSNEGANYVP